METDTIILATEVLKAGKPVIFPTDTVYGLGVAAKFADSPDAIFKLKQRSDDKPIAWLVDGVEALDEYGIDVPDKAYRLAEAQWPGALTIVVKASDKVPPAYRAADGTIGLRMPDNDTALRLIRVAGPIATSSANVSGAEAPSRAADLDPDLLANVAVVVEDDSQASGTPSTVLDCSQDKPVLIRQGEAMEETIFTVPIEYVSHTKKTNINAKLWTSSKFGSPDNPGTEDPKAVIQIVHGMAEYIDRYDDLARYLVERGFVVCAEDHVGHGGSVNSADEYGHIPLKGGKNIIVGDVHTLHRMVARTFPDVPYVMYGHSMGSFIVRAYIARYGDELTACVLSGTGNVPANLSKLGNTLARFIASIKGETYHSKLIDGMGAGGYGKQIENARTDLDWLSTDEAVVDAYIADEKCGFMFTLGGYTTLLDLTGEVVTPECAEKVPKELPVLFVAGDGDPVGDMGEGVKAAAQLLRDAGVQTVDCKIYEGMRHEIHNEIGKDQVYDDIATWIEAHV
ncbi:MAG: threonylcarbamoyl-AMP synthase [Eggerthellaceae bacterium]|nr:threonylcarbamoyl-AMP synthase [Eggerthellaceae bacterium]